ncbi:hypothetical protein BH23ACT4_BH23ACT4_01190 [soil metagenome]
MIVADQSIHPTVKWLLVGTAGYSLGSVIADPLLSVAATAGATLCVLVGILLPVNLRIPLHILGGALVILVGVLANFNEMARFSRLSGSYAIWFLLAVATGLSVFFAQVESMRRLTVALAFLTTLVGSLTILIPDWQADASSDVFRAHAAAGEALLAGENPYSDTVVFVSGDPNKPDGTLVEGYPYPPPSLFSYGILAAITDPRVVSLTSWIVVALGLAVLGARRDQLGSISLVVLALMATIPIWRMALFMSWTEPLSVALIGASLIGISKHRRWGWVVLGIALASKQYLVFLAPLALFYRDRDGRRPGWLAIAVSGVVAGVPVLFGPSDYIRSVIGNALSIGFRPDTQSINGVIASLGGEVLIPMVALLPIIAALLYATYKMRLSGALLVAAGVPTLAMALLITSAFPNYWMLVAALTGMASIVAVSHDKDRRCETPACSGRDVEIAPSRKQVPEDPVPGDSR